jgi:hypothetical protein
VDDGPDPDPADAGPQPGPGPRSRVRRWLVVLGATLALYVVLAVVWPRTVPRSTLLPKPPDREWFAPCGRWPTPRLHTERWTARGGFWVRSEWTALAGCEEVDVGEG